jgi:hypothetical protein
VRLINYYSVAAQVGSDKIKKPTDLYALPFDKDVQYTEQESEFLERPLTDSEKKMLGI